MTKLLALFIFAIVCAVFALSQGSVAMSLLEVWQALLSSAPNSHEVIIREIRLPRVITAFLVGAMLAIAGALMQILLRNPLADPYILGISGGAAVAVLSGMMLGISGVLLDGLALLGAVLSSLLVFFLGFRQHAEYSDRLLLTGVVIAAGWGALISLLLSLAPDMSLRSMLFWLMGDLSHSPESGYTFLLLLTLFLVLMRYANDLNVLMRGELSAASLGVSVKHIRILLYLSASILTAMAVSLAGSIAFVGLIVPHLLRLFIGTNHKLLLPACFLFGGSFLLLADTLSRTLFLPQTVPVGAITAMLGVPLFIYLMHRRLS